MTDDERKMLESATELSIQVATALHALAHALAKQPAMEGQTLLHDFMSALEGLESSPEQVGAVGRAIAGTISAALEYEHERRRTGE